MPRKSIPIAYTEEETIMRREGVARDDTEAATWFRKAAEQGVVEAQADLGSMYHEGEGVARDYFEAATWLRKAAEQGNAWAQFYLGLMYTPFTRQPENPWVI